MINELSFYEFYESFDFKFDEIDKLIFEKACQGSEDVLDMVYHYEDKIDVAYYGACMNNRVTLIKYLCDNGYGPNEVENIMVVAIVLSSIEILDWFYDILGESCINHKLFNEALVSDRREIIKWLLRKKCQIDYEEAFFIVLHHKIPNSYELMKKHIVTNKETHKIEIVKSMLRIMD